MILFSVPEKKMERSLRSVEPLVYYVNTLSDFDVEVVKAYKTKDNARIKQLVFTGKMDMDLFICVNKSWHGFILCVPAGQVKTRMDWSTLQMCCNLLLTSPLRLCAGNLSCALRTNSNACTG